PPNIARRRTGTRVGDENGLVMLFPPLGVPPISRRQAPDNWRSFQRIKTRRTRDPIQERLPDLLALRTVQSERDHRNRKRVVGVYVSLFAPMIVEEAGAVQPDKLVEKATKCI